MAVPLLDLKAQYETIREDMEREVRKVFESQMFILGDRVECIERQLAAYCGAAFGIGVTSGTDALLIALMNESIGAGDEVITTPFSFFATAGSIARTGARPVFADIDPVTFNLDPAGLEGAASDRTRAVMPVHLFGQLAEMAPLEALARRRGWTVIEDAAQAIGASRDGRAAGACGDYGCFSFFPSKNLGAAGDGGMVTTNDPERARGVRELRNHGMEPKYYHRRIGGNFRLDALQAAVLCVKLQHLDAWHAARARNAERHHELLAERGLVKRGLVRLPVSLGGRHVWNQYTLRVSRRDALRDFLRERNIGCDIYYPVPLHLQECFRDLGYARGDFPVSEKAADEVLSIPVYPELTQEQAVEVADAFAAFYGV
jgi:dTDP-4-amino-4,6-dideoxygalactose transaminase